MIKKLKTYFSSIGQHAKGGLIFLVGAGIFTTALSIGGNIYIESKRLNNDAKFRVLEIQRQYLSEIESLYEIFSAQIEDLSSIKSLPLDSRLKDRMLDNLRMQDQRLAALLTSGYSSNDEVIDGYRENLLGIRKALLVSSEPGQLRDVWLLVGKMVENKDLLSASLLSQNGSDA
jgi:hypothetical protein